MIIRIRIVSKWNAYSNHLFVLKFRIDSKRGTIRSDKYIFWWRKVAITPHIGSSLSALRFHKLGQTSDESIYIYYIWLSLTLGFQRIYSSCVLVFQLKAMENSEKVCDVCKEAIEIYAIGDCDHPICLTCSTRMRILIEQDYCPICRGTLPKVIINPIMWPNVILFRFELCWWLCRQIVGLCFTCNSVGHGEEIWHDCFM